MVSLGPWVRTGSAAFGRGCGAGARGGAGIEPRSIGGPYGGVKRSPPRPAARTLGLRLAAPTRPPHIQMNRTLRSPAVAALLCLAAAAPAQAQRVTLQVGQTVSGRLD